MAERARRVERSIIVLPVSSPSLKLKLRMRSCRFPKEESSYPNTTEPIQTEMVKEQQVEVSLIRIQSIYLIIHLIKTFPFIKVQLPLQDTNLSCFNQTASGVLIANRSPAGDNIIPLSSKQQRQGIRTGREREGKIEGVMTLQARLLSEQQRRQLSLWTIDNLKNIQMANAGELKSLNNSMEAELKAKNFNSPNIISNLKKAKIAIYSQPDLEHQSEDYLKEAVRFSELNLLHTLASRNNKGIENAINNTKFFYENALIPHKPQYHSMITAIHLLFLLSCNKSQEFNTKLQSIKVEHLKDSYIEYVLRLNDAIEEGNYRKAFSLKKQNPLPEYFGAFLDTILETVRIQIAKSAERAYSEISLKAALNIFQFDSPELLRNFVNSYHDSLEEIQINWLFNEDKIVFQKDANKKINFNSEEMIRRTLEYSLELERIA